MISVLRQEVIKRNAERAAWLDDEILEKVGQVAMEAFRPAVGLASGGFVRLAKLYFGGVQ